MAVVARVEEHGKVRCPVCGELLPESEFQAATKDHLLWRENGRWRVVCPHRFEELYPPDSLHYLDVGLESEIRVLKKNYKLKNKPKTRDFMPPFIMQGAAFSSKVYCSCGRRMWWSQRKKRYICPQCGYKKKKV